MSEPSRAVFLSYASQDAEAAQRICEALRAAGIEVWFDQSELRGGDAWDQKIRQQIRDCALFVPIISAHTQARPEGYFRLEWKLAVDRSHLMAAEKAFFVPVVVDATTEPEALVPAQFLGVQWTRIRSGEAPAEFVDRIAALLNQPVAPHVAGPKRATGRAPLRRLPIVLTVLSVTGVVALVIATAMRGGSLWHKPVPKLEASTTSTSAPTTPAAIPEKSVAVLPFVDMSEKKDQEYFADGMAEEILDLLAKIPGLRVPARTSSFYFKGKSEDIPTIARRLMVAHVMEGSVRKSGNHLRITVQLVKADTGYHLWSETYDRTLDDIFKIQDEIAAEVVKALKLSLDANGAPRAIATRNTQAHALILQADFLLGRDTHDDVVRAIAYLQQAIHLDPQSAVGWAELSGALTLEWLYGSLPEGRTWQQQREQALRAAERAVAIDPQLGDAHDALAAVRYWFDWDWGAAQVELERARTLGTEDLVLAGLLAELRGQLNDAMRLWEQASADDPLNFTAYMYRALAHCAIGQFAEALALSDKMVELAPASSRLRAVRAQVLLDLGRSDAAVAVAGSETDPGYRAYALVRTAIVSGRTTDADSALGAFEKTYAADWAYEIAELHALRGDTDQAFAWMDRAHGQHDPALIGVLSVNVDPDMKSLHNEPRWVAFLRKMNLPE